jgi:hypothetical protein
MDIQDFLQDLQADVQEEAARDGEYAELIFCRRVMEHLADIGMTFEPQLCYFKRHFGNSILRLSGWSVSEDGTQLDLFVSLYAGTNEISSIPDTETKQAAEQCLRFFKLAVEGKLDQKIEPSDESAILISCIKEVFHELSDIRVIVLSDRKSKSKSFKPQEVGSKVVKLEVMDIERLYRHLLQGKPRDEIILSFEDDGIQGIPCVYVPGQGEGYDYILTAIPGEALRAVYDRHGPRLLEANVRSFLSFRNKSVNSGIQETLRCNPERFMAFNNGLVIVADEKSLVELPGGGGGLAWLKGVQIVNGGQTTASIFFSKRKNPEINLEKVRVPAKIIILRDSKPDEEERLISDISKFANTQNAVKMSDLSANKPFNVAVERLASSVYCPDGLGRWFYERAAGSYNTLLAREGTTRSKLADLKRQIPPSRKITKTDLAKYLICWFGRPDIASLGAQKCFNQFMDLVEAGEIYAIEPSVDDFKGMVAKGLLFKSIRKISLQNFQAFQSNIACYTLAAFSLMYGNKLSLKMIWDRQAVSPELESFVRDIAFKVAEVLKSYAGEKMLSEICKKEECWESVKRLKPIPIQSKIPEMT